ncbi:helix-turn-helix transcriptional regulator [Streptacidiphilus sp. P02-A3a]|uniref:helix-turn-helix domain-containing protein n=1 Tax=Streptacidiphilus sp. P02-A3a TaxID=2704468 RepID=UPI0015FCFADB|nr:helix-turn-helix transcriptional regulator [Streptacidiphilus sp. P02-A3a]QMU70096.1 helix-turn-helix domain-containing protein [Streptacidiphilus sp. P02-A3a]QMU70451.1 helix-turn-helix domain-containing protein [Streptacidiphilus sp. P02-A3a]
MPDGGKATIRSKRLGVALRTYREQGGFDQAAAASAIRASSTKISRLESGRVSIRPLELHVLLDLYGVDDPKERDRLEALARTSTARGWWLDYQDSLTPGYGDHIVLENDASYIRIYHPVYIPGILQTEAYAEAAIRSGPLQLSQERISVLVKVRRERQARILSEGIPQAVILWEPAIISPAGGREAHTGQLKSLLNLAHEPTISLQVLRFGPRMIGAMGAPFTAFSFGPDHQVEAVALEGLTSTQVHEDADSLAAYSGLFETLRSNAASQDESVAFIENVLRKAEAGK